METNKEILPEKFTWTDAYEAEGEWYSTDYKPEVRIMTTVGYPISHTDTYISIASTYDPDLEQYACIINIPLGMVIAREVVEGVSPETTFTMRVSGDS